MGSTEILGGLYIKPGMKIDRYETEKSHIALWSNLSKSLQVSRFYIGIDFNINTKYELLCACL